MAGFFVEGIAQAVDLLEVSLQARHTPIGYDCQPLVSSEYQEAGGRASIFCCCTAMRKFRIIFVGMVALLGVACATDDSRCCEDHVVSETGEATNTNKLDFSDGLGMSANPYCCGNHWGATTDFTHGLVMSANPYCCGNHWGVPTDFTHGLVMSANPYCCGNHWGVTTDFTHGLLMSANPYCCGNHWGVPTAFNDGSCSSANPDYLEHRMDSTTGQLTDAGGSVSNDEDDTFGVPFSSATVVADQDAVVSLESTLRINQRLRKDATMQVVLTPGSHTESALLDMSVTSRRLFPWTKRAQQTVRLTTDTRVKAASLKSFHVSNCEGAWTFIAADRVERNVWISALVHAIEGPDHAVTSGETDLLSGDNSAAPAANFVQPTTDVLDIKTPAGGMQPREVTLQGPKLKACKVAKDGRATKTCQELTLDRHSDVVPVTKRRLVGRALFRVTAASSSTGKTKLNHNWTFDAGSPDEQARWIALVKGAIHDVKDDGDISTEEFEGSFDSRYRGWKLGPKDRPLVPGMFLARAHNSPVTLEVTEIGDILLSPGYRPDPTQEPLWAHRSTDSFGGFANGGLGCAVEAFWQRLMREEEAPTELSVKNGRWRVGRSMLCTLGRSPAPEGSLRRFLPWDERGSAIRGASLELLKDGTAVISSGNAVLWDSFFG